MVATTSRRGVSGVTETGIWRMKSARGLCRLSRLLRVAVMAKASWLGRMESGKEKGSVLEAGVPAFFRSLQGLAQGDDALVRQQGQHAQE
ncbi:hypothetical protein DLREEDagrD3_05960 [Denitratisoma sp. agr-D3]